VSLRIGIDSRRYSLAGRGQERYVRSLIRALAAADGAHEYVLLANGNHPAETLGPRVTFSPASRRIRLQHRRTLARLGRLLVRDLDVIHFPLADGWYSRVSRTVVTIHDLSVLRYPEVYFLDAAAERRAREHFAAITAGADAVIAVSEATQRDVVELLDVAAGRVATVPHGVEPGFRPPSVSPAGLGLPAPYLLFVGGIDFKKNVARLVLAFALACECERLPHALVLAGPLQARGNPFFAAACAAADRAGIADRLVWVGYVPDGDLPALYAGADVLVFPSLWEGFGFPVLEAMACGTPVVTSAGTAMSEVAGEAALLVDPHDPQAIADGILGALDPDTGRRLAQEGLRRAGRYTWEQTAARTLAVYEAVAAGRSLAEAAQT
jgi:glycosyltransferase involved in cell wall biosynthesis